MDISDYATHLELRIKGRKFQVACINSETRLDTKRKAFTAFELQLVDSDSTTSKPLTKPFHRRYHQFRQLSSHLTSYNFEHPNVPDSGGLFNTSTTEWLVEQRKKSLVAWINQLLDTIEITAVRGRQKAESRLGMDTADSPPTQHSSRTLSPGPPARPIRTAARAIMEFLHPRPEVDPGGDAADYLANMPPTPMNGVGGGMRRRISRSTPTLSRAAQFNSSWSAGKETTARLTTPSTSSTPSSLLTARGGDTATHFLQSDGSESERESEGEGEGEGDDWSERGSWSGSDGGSGSGGGGGGGGGFENGSGGSGGVSADRNSNTYNQDSNKNIDDNNNNNNAWTNIFSMVEILVMVVIILMKTTMPATSYLLLLEVFVRITVIYRLYCLRIFSYNRLMQWIKTWSRKKNKR